MWTVISALQVFIKTLVAENIHAGVSSCFDLVRHPFYCKKKYDMQKPQNHQDRGEKLTRHCQFFFTTIDIAMLKKLPWLNHSALSLGSVGTAASPDNPLLLA